MKTAVSIPDDLFRDADRYARRAGKSRSRLYSEALAEYLARHTVDTITATMDRVCEDVGQGSDPFVTHAGRRALELVEW